MSDATDRIPVSSYGIAKKILLVEDEPSLVITLSDRLISEGYWVETAGDGEKALDWCTRQAFDLVILDVMLPGRNGFDVCQEMRRRDWHFPILMLTARRETVDKVVGLKLGADDYLTKPFEMIELLARVQALMRRSGSARVSSTGSYRFGPIAVDFNGCEVRKDGALVPMTALDFKLLRYFIEHRGEVLSRDTLLDEVWGYDNMLYTRTVDVHVAGLRQKLEPTPVHPQYIVTVHRAGYKFLG